MLERFTDRARRVVVLAQAEARGLDHHYIGTEHLLLALLDEADGIAAQALRRFGMSPSATREEVIARVGTGTQPLKSRIPFTPRAKKVLEFGLREALRLGHHYIGTEHLLLGLLRDPDGVGAQIIAAHGDLNAVRMAVLDLIGEKTAGREASRRPWIRGRERGPGGEPDQLPTTPAADHSLAEAARLAGEGPVGSHHLLLAALGDPESAAARTLISLGLDLDQAQAALRQADVRGTSDEPPEERGRRQMLLRVSEDRLTLEATDPALVALARGATAALDVQGGDPGTIPGELAASASLAAVWQSLRDSLEEICRAAGGEERPPSPARRAPVAEGGRAARRGPRRGRRAGKDRPPAGPGEDPERPGRQDS
jgi:ATP-dependent Clp protease ATP-binding subunit ClpA